MDKKLMTIINVFYSNEYLNEYSFDEFKNIWKCTNVEIVRIDISKLFLNSKINLPNEIANLIHVRYIDIHLEEESKICSIGNYIDFIRNNDKLIIFTWKPLILMDHTVKYINILADTNQDDFFACLSNNLEYLQITIFRYYDFNVIFSNLPPSLKILNIYFSSYYSDFYSDYGCDFPNKYENFSPCEQHIKNTIKAPFPYYMLSSISKTLKKLISLPIINNIY